MSEPRVLFVSSHAGLGGSEAYLEQLLDRLGPAWSAGVVALADGPFVARLRAQGHEVAVAPAGRRLGLLAGAARLAREVRRRRPDVVHANGVKAALVAGLAAGRTPVVWVKHDLFWDGPLARLIARRAARVVAVSGVVARAVAGPRTRVVHNGIPEPGVDPERGRRSVAELLGGGRAVALVGRLEPVKGQEHLLDALAQVRAGGVDARALLVGAEDPAFPGHGDRLLERAAALGVDGVVAITGRREDAVELVAGSELLVVPTVPDARGMGREGFGLAGVEAQWVGTPVVGYADGALPEVLGPWARLVAPGDTGALAGAIAELLADDAERARLAEGGRAWARGRYGLDRVVDAMRETYREVAR